MTKEQIIKRGREVGLNEFQLSADIRQLIPIIQQALGQIPCYMSDTRYQCNVPCEWQGSCKKLTATWLR